MQKVVRRCEDRSERLGPSWLESRRVHIARITAHPNEGWMKQIARNVSMDEWGFLGNCRYFIHDRDAKYTESFREILKAGHVNCIRLPAKSPNLRRVVRVRIRKV
jgi:putative transposase